MVKSEKGAQLFEYVILVTVIAIFAIPAIRSYSLKLKCNFCVQQMVLGDASAKPEEFNTLLQGCVDNNASKAYCPNE